MFSILGIYLFYVDDSNYFVSVRISLRKNPVLRDRLFTVVLAGAVAHGVYLVYPFFFSLSFPFLNSLFVFARILNILIICQISCQFNVEFCDNVLGDLSVSRQECF